MKREVSTATKLYMPYMYGCTLILMLSIILYSTQGENFTSEAILIPAENYSSNPSRIENSQLANLVSMTGVSIGGTSSIDRVFVGIEKIKSRPFFRNYILHMFGSELFPESDSLSFTELYEQFHSDNFSLSRDRVSNSVVIRASTGDPQLSYELVNYIVESINMESRENALTDAQMKVDYLTDLLNERNELDLKQTLNALLVRELQNVMLATVEKQFLFKTISEPSLADDVNKKKLAPYLLFFISFSFIFSLGVRFLRKYYFGNTP